MSKILSCIIVDDEPPAVRVLQKYAEQLPDLNCIAASNNSIEALQLIQELKPDVLFLDIQMPELTGIQLSTLLKDKVYIIFTTAYAQFALDGFELNAVDYLLKPISFNRFIQSVEKVKTRIQKPENNVWGIEADFFFVKTDGKNRFKKIKLDDVFYLESIKNYVVIHLGNEEIVTYNTLKYFEESLPENQFVKIHKSYLISMNKIEKTDTNEVWISDKNLPLGDTYKNEFFDRINKRVL
ncbi:LytR/AlgR family response regulator transcription factor [Moheibacter sediminis]|uniref:Two component transcriptional regulator, LytTR family n=1 Tax=Moheibacter sediminis TaxID=1434700 RepID=A0A1W1ZC15_9FLAO|nr:LytTR family transcriptional regulator DNA-binding domain-containing protein [Moheibacter sediminis]SMC45917.1 two component transcriptional regulator, LytTR family [Moheibacter sediminis]